MATQAPNDAGRLREAINTADAIAHDACDDIQALAAAALDCLDFDAHKLERARHLIRMIDEAADLLGNAINWQAEQVGANHVDEADRARSRALWDKHHALHGAGGAAGVAHPAHTGGQP